MLIGFPPIFVADTNIIYGYKFVAPLNEHAPHKKKVIRANHAPYVTKFFS